MNARDYSALNLLPQHAELLAASAISPEVAKARGYWSATKKVQLRALGFAETQCHVPALVVPVFDVSGDMVFSQARFDTPQPDRKGKLQRYQTPKGMRMAIDVPRAMRRFPGQSEAPTVSDRRRKKSR